MPTQKQIRDKLAGLPDWQKPAAYLLSTEHYDVSAKGETKRDWVRDAAEGSGYDPYLVSINTGGYTGLTVAVLAGHPDEALQTADEWACTRFYEGDYDACEEARGRGEGVVSVQPLMSERWPKKTMKTSNSTNPGGGRVLRGLATAGLALVGVGGVVMGVRESKKNEGS